MNLKNIDIKKYAQNALAAAIRNQTGRSGNGRFTFFPNESCEVIPGEVYYPTSEDFSPYVIGEPSTHIEENPFDTPKIVPLIAKCPISSLNTAEVSTIITTGKTVSANIGIDLGLNAKVPDVLKYGTLEGNAKVSFGYGYNKKIDFSTSSKQTTTTNTTPPDKTFNLSCAPHTRSEFTIVYFGGNPEVEITAQFKLMGTKSITGTNAVTGKENVSFNRALASMEYSKENDSTKRLMIITADQLAQRIGTYSPPSDWEFKGSTSDNSLKFNANFTETINQGFAPEVYKITKPLSLSGLAADYDKEITVYSLIKNEEIQEEIQEKILLLESDALSILSNFIQNFRKK